MSVVKLAPYESDGARLILCFTLFCPCWFRELLREIESEPLRDKQSTSLKLIFMKEPACTPTSSRMCIRKRKH
jgi:hypothetical protein